MFNSISAWIMSITGIICLSVLVELILPNGQMNKYIKGIFSFIILLVIISPIPKLLHKEFDYTNMFGNNEIQVQEDYIYQINLDKISAIQNNINDEIVSYGYCNVVARIDSDIFDSTISFKAVYVDLSQLNISKEAVHTNIIDIKKDILKIVTSLTNLENERVVFNE